MEHIAPIASTYSRFQRFMVRLCSPCASESQFADQVCPGLESKCPALIAIDLCAVASSVFKASLECSHMMRIGSLTALLLFLSSADLLGLARKHGSSMFITLTPALLTPHPLPVGLGVGLTSASVLLTGEANSRVAASMDSQALVDTLEQLPLPSYSYLCPCHLNLCLYHLRLHSYNFEFSSCSLLQSVFLELFHELLRDLNDFDQSELPLPFDLPFFVSHLDPLLCRLSSRLCSHC